MAEKSKKLLFSEILMALMILEGLLAVLSIFRIPFQPERAVLFGLSKSRLVIVAACLCIMILLISCQVLFSRSFAVEKKGSQFSDAPFSFIPSLIIAVCWYAFLLGIFLLVLYFSPQRNFDSAISSVIGRIWGIIGWGLLLSIEIPIWIYLNLGRQNIIFMTGDLPVYLALFTMGYCFVLLSYGHMDWGHWGIFIGGICILQMIPVWLWTIFKKSKFFSKHKSQINTFLTCFFIGVLTFSIYRTVGIGVKRINSPSKAYWDLLADAFNHGHLDLTAPPTTHDLTLYNGKWYVPNPPLPAILLMPVVALLGVEGVNMTIVSALLGSLNAVIVYLVLRYAAESGMTACKRSANLWLTAVFALSTNHIWLATTGQMWFISQLVTILFIGLGTIAVIRGKPAWVSGLMIGMAVMARPNIFPIAIFLMGIYLWKAKPYPEVEWGKVVRWAIGFGIPVLICVFMELLYNYLRFEDWFDFGYVTINGAESIVEAVQKYGMFHPHFLRENFEVMFLRMPRIDTTGERFFFQPGYAGYSIFAMTPAFIYLIRGIKKNWWVIGAWVSVILTVGLLLLYHNTGASQVGYRYIQDAIIPLLLLLGVGVGEKPGILFKMLTILGVVINLLSTYWWYIGRA